MSGLTPEVATGNINVNSDDLADGSGNYCTEETSNTRTETSPQHGNISGGVKESTYHPSNISGGVKESTSHSKINSEGDNERRSDKIQIGRLQIKMISIKRQIEKKLELIPNDNAQNGTEGVSRRLKDVIGIVTRNKANQVATSTKRTCT